MKPGALLIRADASLAIGTGHVMRCLALAQAWQDAGGQVTFVAAELPESLSARLVSEHIAVHRVDISTHALATPAPGGPEDAARTVALVGELNADWIVIDGDRFDVDFLQTVRASGLHALLIDDFAARESFPVDLIVNPDPEAEEGTYRKRGARGPFLIGTTYILLRRELREAIPRKEIRRKGTRILVSLGGSDPENLAPRIAEALGQNPELQVTVIAGPSYDKTDELRKVNASNLRVVVDPPNIAPLMRDSDIAIIAAGGTLWELLSAGCAVLSYSRNDVQARVVRAFAKRGIVADMGETRNFNPTELASAVAELMNEHGKREMMSSRGRAIVDGLGASRVVKAMLQKLQESENPE
jgi:UDP-2,4-diacetamido-2,4,6-trideoxy-beta-L-altropyranose hydrolase